MAQAIWTIGLLARTWKQAKKRKQAKFVPSLDKEYEAVVEQERERIFKAFKGKAQYATQKA